MVVKTTPSQSRTSSPTGLLEAAHTGDVDIDEENYIESEKPREDSPCGEGEELFPPGEEPQSQTIVAPKAEEKKEDMPGCVDQGVIEEAREGEAMVTAKEVLSVMKAQAGVAEEAQASAEVESEEMDEEKVEPVQREQLPLTE